MSRDGVIVLFRAAMFAVEHGATVRQYKGGDGSCLTLDKVPPRAFGHLLGAGFLPRGDTTTWWARLEKPTAEVSS